MLLYYAWKTNTEGGQLGINSPLVIRKYTKFTNFTRLYIFLILRYFNCNQTLQFYYKRIIILSNCGEIFA